MLKTFKLIGADENDTATYALDVTELSGGWKVTHMERLDAE